MDDHYRVVGMQFNTPDSEHKGPDSYLTCVVCKITFVIMEGNK